MSLEVCHDLFMESTNITIPPNILALLEATALANNCDPEEIVLSAIEAFLENDEISEE